MDAVLKKVEEGKKLSMEDLVVLMMGMFRETKISVDETNKRMDEIINMVMSMSDKVDKRIEETNKRIE